MTTHTQAREFAHQALTALFGIEPTEGEIKALAGIACLETHYGDGWKGAGAGSYNMGAIQCANQWASKWFSYGDTKPKTDGSSTKYAARFRKYDSAVDGWVDLVKVAYVNRGRHIVREAAQTEDWLGVSTGLHSTVYYEGFGKTAADRIHNHLVALTGAIARADEEALAGR
jgi:Mannosyl-glycoprotein endo-beta-N-acetylglucosaminidase.